MWTICWTDSDGYDRWDRFEEREDIINLANTLVREGDMSEEGILIFPPAADALTIPYSGLEK